MEQKNDNGAEKTLTTLATIILVVGSVLCLLCGLSFMILLVSHEYSAIVALLAAIPVLFGTLVTWSIMKVLANISLTLKDINKKLGKEPKAA
ncbi:MAG: hypothetical protein IJ739_00140 [Bacteroidaceae bacterium]|nr:hypothetical protein [Bacteroidaceae bacterium]